MSSRRRRVRISQETQISLIHSQTEEDEQGVDATDPTDDLAQNDQRDALLNERAGELVSLIVGFAFALQ